MKDFINKRIDQISEYLAYRKGLLPVIGILLVFTNWIIQLVPGIGWLAGTNTFLHIGIIVAILGFMIAWAL